MISNKVTNKKGNGINVYQQNDQMPFQKILKLK